MSLIILTPAPVYVEQSIPKLTLIIDKLVENDSLSHGVAVKVK